MRLETGEGMPMDLLVFSHIEDAPSKKMLCPDQVAQSLRASSSYAKAVGLIPVRAHTRNNQ